MVWMEFRKLSKCNLFRIVNIIWQFIASKNKSKWTTNIFMIDWGKSKICVLIMSAASWSIKYHWLRNLLLMCGNKKNHSMPNQICTVISSIFWRIKNYVEMRSGRSPCHYEKWVASWLTFFQFLVRTWYCTIHNSPSYVSLTLLQLRER